MILLTILICSASTAFSYQMENFEAGKCKVGSNDLVLWGISYLKCLHECRARAACTSINVNQKVGECRLNFDDANIQNKSCGLYVYSEKSNWKEKTLCGHPTCEQESNEKTNPDCTCTVEECKKMQRPDDCFLMGNGRLIGHKVVYVYRDAQNVSTSLQYKCLDDGTWSGKPLEDCTGRLIMTPAPTRSRTENGHTTESTLPTKTSAHTEARTTLTQSTTPYSTSDTKTFSEYNSNCMSDESLALDISNNACVQDCPMPANTIMPRYGLTYQKYENKTITDPGNLTGHTESKSSAVRRLKMACREDPDCRAISKVIEGGEINITTYHGKGRFQIGEPTGHFEYAKLYVRNCA